MKPKIENRKAKIIRVALLAAILLALAGTKSGANEDRIKDSGFRIQENGPLLTADEQQKQGIEEGAAFAITPIDTIRAWMLQPPVPKTQHHFFDRQNIALIAAGAGLRAADVYTTHRFIALGGNELILPRALVTNTPAFAIYSSGMVAATGGFMYLAHRKNHHRIERAIGWLHAAFVAGLVRNNQLYIQRLQNR